VPEEVGILGIGNDPLLCEGTRPALSSVAMDEKGTGAAALRVLLAKIDGGEVPKRTLLGPGRLVLRESTALVRPGDSLVTRAVELMRGHLEGGMDLDGLARRTGTSRRTLIRHFQRTLGRNPGAVWRELRLQTAMRMLSASDEPLSGIAQDCGFTDQAHLTRVMKAAIGETPAAFRRRRGL
jgi:LacI family transcriptional regulator